MTALATPARTALAGLGALLLAGGLAACGSSDTASSTPSSAPAATTGSTAGSGAPASVASGTLTAADQTGDGSTLKVASVDLKGADGGWVAVHVDLAGKPGPVVGVAQVKKGATTNVTVTLDKKVATGAFWPMLHVDDHTVGSYEFPKVPGADLPVKDGSDIVMKKITLTVA